MLSKRYEIKRGCLFYREELCFKTAIHETAWKVYMRYKGCRVTEMLTSK